MLFSDRSCGHVAGGCGALCGRVAASRDVRSDSSRPAGAGRAVASSSDQWDTAASPEHPFSVATRRRAEAQARLTSLPAVDAQRPACLIKREQSYITPDIAPSGTSTSHFFYGFVSVGIAWQIAFLVIGTDPVRFRPLMLPSILEKLGYVVGTTALYVQGRLSPADAGSAIPDALLMVLFMMAFLKTPSHTHGVTSDRHTTLVRTPGRV